MKLPADHPLHLVLGLGIWSAWFIAAYGSLSVFCSANSAVGDEVTIINIGLLALTAFTCVLLGLLAVWCWHRGKRFTGRVSVGLYIAAVIATAGVGAPIIYLPPCV